LPSPDIFLSYNREDQAVAKRFAEAIEVAGLSVWWDVTLRSGEAYDRVTEEALRTAKAVVVLWSPRSVDSRWVRAEASIADENGTLVPATIEACQLPVMFRLTQTADLSNWRGEAEDPTWQAFLNDVRRMAGRDKLTPEYVSPIPEKPPADGGMPVVAVLPVQFRGDGKLEYIAEDLTEDITRELSQSFYCKVIAASTMSSWRGRAADHRALQRALGARYAVEGRLQDLASNLRLTVQLIDAETDNALWSSRFSGKLDETEGAPERLALSVAIELDQNIGKNEITRANAKHPPCSAWEHCLRAWMVGGIRGHGHGLEAVEEARKAIAAAPDYGLAHALLASTLASRTQFDRLLLGDTDRRALIRESHEAIQRAIRLDSNNPIVLTRLAETYGMLGDAEAGLRLAQRATMLAPNSAEAQYSLGFANFMLGRTTEVIEAIGKQERVGPPNSMGLSDNVRWGSQAQLGICLFIEDRSVEAEAAIDNSLMLQPTYYLSLRWKAIIAADLGKEESARAAVRLLRQIESGKTIDEYLDSNRHLPVEHPRKYEAIEILRRLLEECEDGE
jgi:TolB-like protein/Tfp pilus assembly protein PilF